MLGCEGTSLLSFWRRGAAVPRTWRSTVEMGWRCCVDCASRHIAADGSGFESITRSSRWLEYRLARRQRGSFSMYRRATCARNSSSRGAGGDRERQQRSRGRWEHQVTSWAVVPAAARGVHAGPRAAPPRSAPRSRGRAARGGPATLAPRPAPRRAPVQRRQPRGGAARAEAATPRPEAASALRSCRVPAVQRGSASRPR
jgi:hypothetical protein